MKRLWQVTFLSLMFSFGMALAEESVRRNLSLEEEYERVIREIEIKKRRQDSLEKKEKSLLADLDRLAFFVDRRRKELRSFEKELTQTEKAISSQQTEMSRLREQISTTQTQIQARAAALYKISKVGPWAFFLSAESYADFLRMVNFLTTVMNHDIRLFTGFESQLERRKVLREELTANQNRLWEEQEKVRRKAEEVKKLRRERKDTLKKVRAAKTGYGNLIEELEKQAQRLQDLIESLPSQGEKPYESLSGFGALRGNLPLPVAGKIQKNPQRGLRGISLKAPHGTIARAVWRGRVVYAGWFKGYGNLLIIDHGDRFHTVMGHASELLKKENDWVETGDSVARIGSTGSLGDPSLYFEIRQDGKPINPLEWFSKKDQLALK